MYKALLKIRLQAMFDSMFKTSRQKNQAVKYLMCIALLYAIGSIGFAFGMLFQGLCTPLCQSGQTWLYFSIVAILSFFLSFIGSVFAAQTQLFEAKDNELLLSMPFTSRAILVSRMSLLFLIDYIFELPVAAAAGVVYIHNFGATAWGVTAYVLLFILLPFLVMALSCFFGWLLAMLMTKIKNRTQITMALYLALLFGYIYVYGKANSLVESVLINSERIASTIKLWLLPFYYFGDALANHNILSLALVAAIALGAFAIVFFAISRSYLKILMNPKKTVRVQYKQREEKANGVFAALVKKELKFFLSRPNYMMNTGIGVIFAVLLSVMVVVKGDELIATLVQTLPGAQKSLGALVCLLLTACISMCDISSPSISLEGKNIWIPKTLPVTAGTILKSKAAAHIAVCIPFIVVSGAVLCFALEATVVTRLMYFAIPIAASVMSGLLGVCVNMKMPKLEWVSETVVIKQSASVLVAMMASMALSFIPIAAYAVVTLGAVSFSVSADVLLLGVLVYFALLSALFYALMLRKSEEKLLKI